MPVIVTVLPVRLDRLIGHYALRDPRRLPFTISVNQFATTQGPSYCSGVVPQNSRRSLTPPARVTNLWGPFRQGPRVYVSPTLWAFLFRQFRNPWDHREIHRVLCEIMLGLHGSQPKGKTPVFFYLPHQTCRVFPRLSMPRRAHPVL